MSVRVEFYQTLYNGEKHHMFTVFHHPEALIPQIGQSVNYGQPLIVEAVTHRYKMSERGVYDHHFIEVHLK